MTEQNLKRTKLIEKDGARITIAPLTLEQIEQYIAPLENLADKGAAKIKSYELVCNGLNNALDDDAPETSRWTQEKLRKVLDMPMFELLQREVLIFSGFKLDRETSKDSSSVSVPGESHAASDAANSPTVADSSPSSTSGTSAAA